MLSTRPNSIPFSIYEDTPPLPPPSQLTDSENEDHDDDLHEADVFSDDGSNNIVESIETPFDSYTTTESLFNSNPRLSSGFTTMTEVSALPSELSSLSMLEKDVETKKYTPMKDRPMFRTPRSLGNIGTGQEYTPTKSQGRSSGTGGKNTPAGGNVSRHASGTPRSLRAVSVNRPTRNSPLAHVQGVGIGSQHGTPGSRGSGMNLHHAQAQSHTPQHPTQQQKGKEHYPLVLLHITLLPLSLQYSATTLMAVLPDHILRNFRLLEAKMADGVLMQRGILIPHPRDEYDILEERLLESLELTSPRILKCGHFLGADGEDTEGDDGATEVGSQLGSSRRSSRVGSRRVSRAVSRRSLSINSAALALTEIGGDADSVHSECVRRTLEDELDDADDEDDRPVCEECHHRIKHDNQGAGYGKKRWDVKIYAANGLMRAGAWSAAWSEMERVDVEIMPWVPVNLRRELERKKEQEETEEKRRREEKKEAERRAAEAKRLATEKALEEERERLMEEQREREREKEREILIEKEEEEEHQRKRDEEREEERKKAAEREERLKTEIERLRTKTSAVAIPTSTPIPQSQGAAPTPPQPPVDIPSSHHYRPGTPLDADQASSRRSDASGSEYESHAEYSHAHERRRHRSATETYRDQSAQTRPHTPQSPDEHGSRTRTRSGIEQIPLSTLLQNYIFILAQDPRNLAIFILGTLVLGLASMYSSSDPASVGLVPDVAVVSDVPELMDLPLVNALDAEIDATIEKLRIVDVEPMERIVEKVLTTTMTETEVQKLVETQTETQVQTQTETRVQTQVETRIQTEVQTLTSTLLERVIETVTSEVYVPTSTPEVQKSNTVAEDVEQPSLSRAVELLTLVSAVSETEPSKPTHNTSTSPELVESVPAILVAAQDTICKAPPTLGLIEADAVKSMSTTADSTVSGPSSNLHLEALTNETEDSKLKAAKVVVQAVSEQESTDTQTPLPSPKELVLASPVCGRPSPASLFEAPLVTVSSESCPKAAERLCLKYIGAAITPASPLFEKP